MTIHIYLCIPIVKRRINKGKYESAQLLDCFDCNDCNYFASKPG